MNKKKLALWHMAFWLIAPAVVIPNMIRAGAGSAIPYWITAYLFYISSFYVNLFLILPRWVRKRKIFPLLLSWLGLIVFYTIVILFINRAFGVFQKGSAAFKIGDWFFTSCSYMGVLYSLSFFYRFAFDWFLNDRVKQEMEKSNLKIELAFLKSQINPHFLFNTLNNIYVLAYQQSTQTPDAIMRLSEMMHYMLYESSDESVALSKEIHYIEQLMALQRLRVNGPMSFDFSVTGEVDNYQIAPLLLVNFAENIFKHAVLNDDNDPAVMHLTLEEKKLSLYCRNRINHVLKDKEGGIGLVNIKRRIELLYPARHHFKIDSDAIYYSTHLTIQFD